MLNLNGHARRPARRPFPHPAHPQDDSRFSCAAPDCTTPARFYPTLTVGARNLFGSDPIVLTPATPLCKRHAVHSFWFREALAQRLVDQATSLMPSGFRPDWNKATFGKTEIQGGAHPHPEKPERDA